jgi:hypothetical protein
MSALLEKSAHDLFFITPYEHRSFIAYGKTAGRKRMMSSKKPQPESAFQGHGLKKLTMEQVEQIDEMLARLGEYGEIRLIVQRGELKYINKVESHKAWNTDEES